MISRSENLRRAVRFERPEWIPMSFHVNAACWNHYPHDALQDLMEGHPLLFPGFRRRERVEPRFGVNQREGQPYTDPWGCVWTTSEDGITGTVTGHPLADWSAFDGYRPPDPAATDGLAPVDWERTRARMAEARARGDLVRAGLRHGHTFLQLCDIRGYENLLFDMVDDDPRLRRLIAMVEDFNLALVRRFVDYGAQWVSYGEDLGMQFGPMVSPDHFRTYIKPSYERLMAPAREAGCIIHMHSDGDIRALVDDMIASGVEVLNLQDLVNGMDRIAGRLAGKVCIDLDIDRQHVTPRGTPADVDRLVREAVEKLGSREGGLTMVYGLYPGVPLVNVAALMDAMERYAGYHS
ncbi:MAG: uroporphyrinogen decarboxylase family protein [Planctomycetota bacterium]